MTAARTFGTINVVAGRTEDLLWSVYGPDSETPLEIAAEDVIRFKLCATVNGTPALDLDSLAGTDNDSIVTIDELGESGVTPASGTVRLAQGDTAALSGKYYAELLLVDNSETDPADAIKVICMGQLHFNRSQGGDVGV